MKNNTYIDWVEKVGKLRRERQNRQMHEMTRIMFDENGNFLLLTGMGPTKAVIDDMIKAKEENFETDQELQERIWSF